MNSKTPNPTLTRDVIKSLPKVLIHEHLDCSLRPLTMLELWQEVGFEKASVPFPPHILRLWDEARQAPDGKYRQVAESAAEAYRKWIYQFASQSLANYVAAIVQHVLPVMQSAAYIERIMKERIEDAVADGVVALEIRLAVQLFTNAGLTLEQAMDALVAGMKNSPIPVYITLCALRHENAEMASKLVEICVKYADYVGGFDLAADEAAPNRGGVLDWYMKAAAKLTKLRQHKPIKIKCHLWETNEPVPEDVHNLQQAGIEVIGHGIRGNEQGHLYLEVCPTSNIVTGQIASIAEHPIDRLYRSGKKVTIQTDGTLFTDTDMTNEFLVVHKQFGWDMEDFYASTLCAIDASNFADSVKADLRKLAANAYLNQNF